MSEDPTPARPTSGAAPTGDPPRIPPAAVIFDWDGVLADSAGTYLGLYRAVAAHFGKACPVASLSQWREWYQPRWERNFEALGLGGERLAEAIAWASSSLRYDGVPLFPGVPAVLDDLSGDCRLAIASTTSARRIEGVLEREGLRSRFALVLGGAAGGSDKSGMVGEALRVLAAGNERTVVVGDTTADVEAARHWGLAVVGATYGWMSPHRLAQSRPDAQVAAPAAIPEAVRRLLDQGGGSA